MLVQHVLDRLGREVLALADDDVLLAAGDAEIAVRVDHAEVAATEEAVGGERLGLQSRVDVADAHLGTEDEDLALAPRGQIAAVLVDDAATPTGHHAAVGVRALVFRIVGCTAREHRALGHSIRAKARCPHSSAHLADQLRRHVGRTGRGGA